MKDRRLDPALPPVPPSHSVLFATDSRIATAGGPGGNPGRNWLPWFAAVGAVLLLAGLAFLSRGGDAPAGSSTAASYAAYLVLSDIRTTQVTDFAGNQLTYVDGTISNRGSRTVISAIVSVIFAGSAEDELQTERTNLNVVRTLHPYVETESLTEAPLQPAATRSFRLIFDNVSPDWNRRTPRVEVLSLTFRR